MEYSTCNFSTNKDSLNSFIECRQFAEVHQKVVLYFTLTLGFLYIKKPLKNHQKNTLKPPTSTGRESTIEAADRKACFTVWRGFVESVNELIQTTFPPSLCYKSNSLQNC